MARDKIVYSESDQLPISWSDMDTQKIDAVLCMYNIDVNKHTHIYIYMHK